MKVLDTTLYNPCQVRVAAPRGPARRTIHETCGQDVVPDGRYGMRIHRACRSGSSGAGRRRADPVLYRTLRIGRQRQLQTASTQV